MGERASPIDPTIFTYLFYYIIYESEEREKTIEAEEIYEMAFTSLGTEELAESFLLRFTGLVHLLEELEEAGYICNLEGEMKFHPAIFDAGANARIRPNGHFPEKPFFSKLKELTNGKYDDFEFGV